MWDETENFVTVVAELDGYAGLVFDASGSTDMDGDLLDFAWTYQRQGEIERPQRNSWSNMSETGQVNSERSGGKNKHRLQPEVDPVQFGEGPVAVLLARLAAGEHARPHG